MSIDLTTDNVDNPLDKLNSDRAQEIADAEGLDIVQSTPFVLQLDLDSPEAVDRFYELYPLFERLYPIKGYTETTSRSGNTHIYVDMEMCMSIEQRCLFQACLGSDPKRELLSYKRHLTGDPSPLLLFEVPDPVSAAA